MLLSLMDVLGGACWPLGIQDKRTVRLFRFRFGGTGLGLSLVKDMVEAHHGRVGLKSSQGADHGSTFFFVLPIKQLGERTSSTSKHSATILTSGQVDDNILLRTESHASTKASLPELPFKANCPVTMSPSEKQADHPQHQGLKMKVSDLTDRILFNHHSDLYGQYEILSVDDDAVNHVVIENALALKGHKMTACMSGVEALELLESRGADLPDLVLLVSKAIYATNRPSKY